MITSKEIEATKLSPTKKDFYQIWNELLETAEKISERWSPESTNEADPGIVLLKVLTGVADKLNYNIDKNILEAYMPSATQEESMRKLCEMMGYNIKYYQSATTEVTVSYVGTKTEDGKIATTSTNSDGVSSNNTAWTGQELIIPQFSTITNEDEDVNYFTLEPISFYDNTTTSTVTCLEGQLVQCNTDTDGIININHLDDNFRYYLPETEIAENGIFVYNINNSSLSDRWEQVNNLNIQQLGYHCYKFGYDSVEKLPYLQFPEDISTIIEDGLEIFYTRTTGINGNISANVLSKISVPTSDNSEDTTDPWNTFTSSDFTAINYSASTNGKNKETLDKAYNNYKKTIGTFDTLVTCRDYLNKIYSLYEDDKTTPLVSNVLVTDIRNDINKAITLCSFNNFGICYKTISSKDSSTNEDKITNFDLILYPFAYTSLANKKSYIKSYTYDSSNYNKILDGVEENKTIYHNIKLPNSNDIVCIKNYLQLKVVITTTKKVSSIEQTGILSNIKAAIYEQFNMRNIDFNEEIPIETITDCIKNADTRIKNVNAFVNNNEIKVAVKDDSNEYTYSERPELFAKLIARNVLAGRIQLFNYDNSFKTNYDEQQYKHAQNYSAIYPNDDKQIITLKPKCIKDISQTVVLGENEVIQFRAPNFRTALTYPAYVNYFIHLNDTASGTSGVAAKFENLKDFFTKTIYYYDDTNTEGSKKALDLFIDKYKSKNIFVKKDITTEDAFNTYEQAFSFIYKIENNEYVKAESFVEGIEYYCIDINESKIFTQLANFINHLYCKKENGKYTDKIYYFEKSDNLSSTEYEAYYGIYRSLGAYLDKVPGNLIDEDLTKYQRCTKFASAKTPYFENYFVQVFEKDTLNNGLGTDPVESGIAANSEYKLKPGEWITFNYTSNDQQINKTYRGSEDTIILKPNFTLSDSLWVNTNLNKNYSKTNISGIDVNKDVPGMYSLGSNDQIEIREPVEIKLAGGVYLYWELADGSKDLGSKFIKDSEDSTKFTYVLEDGEYLFYTDANKNSMAYYGNGTQLSITAKDKKEISKLIGKLTTTEATTEDILTNGINVVPWIRTNFDSTNPLILTEYQYINLTQFDELYSVTTKDNITELTSDKWLKVSAASYCTKTSSEDSGEHAELTPIQIDTACWEARALLSLNVGTEKRQTLNKDDTLEIIFKNGESLELNPNIGDKCYPITFQTNYNLSETKTEIDVRTYSLSATDDTQTEIDDFKIKLFEQNSDFEKGFINLHNYSEEYTKISGEEWTSYCESKSIGVQDQEITSLNINLDKNQYALIMFYVIANKYNSIKGNSIPPYLEDTNKSLTIFNNNNSWWDGFSSDSKYYLKDGLNIIKVSNSTTLKLYSDSIKESKNGEEIYKSNAIIIFGDISVINVSGEDRGIATKLLGLDQLNYSASSFLELLNSMIPNNDSANTDDGTSYNRFYYNCPIENNVAINIDYYADKISQVETLLDYNMWFEKNNINNQFVISEIDADYLNDNLSIDKASRL